jgi:leader peptidase (prepilin peptidase) / N-methyltransferase
MADVIELLRSSGPLLVGCCLALGLLVGSFLNVVIFRLPHMLQRQWRQQCTELAAESARPAEAAAMTTPQSPPASQADAPFNLVVPRSACPQCKAPIGALQNIPVLSYLVLRGRCARCKAPIGVRYPLVELLTGLTSAVVAWRFGFTPFMGAALVLTWFLIALTFIDLDHQLLPDNLTLPLVWLGLLTSLLWGSASPGEPLPVDLRASVIGALAGYLSLWSLYHLFRLLTGKEGMGYGDFKLLAALGAWLGWRMLLPVVLAAAAVGAIVGIVLITRGKQQRGVPIPFGPFLASAGWLVLLFGHDLVERYLSLYSR